MSVGMEHALGCVPDSDAAFVPLTEDLASALRGWCVFVGGDGVRRVHALDCVVVVSCVPDPLLVIDAREISFFVPS